VAYEKFRLKLDPRNLIALRVLATRFAQKVYRGVSGDIKGDISRAEDLIARAFAVDPNDAGTHAAKAGVLFDQSRMEESAAEAQKAIELNPSDMFAYFLLCGAENGAGKPENASARADEAMRLSPRDPTLFLFFFQKGWASLRLQRYDDSIVWFRKVLPLAPNSVPTLLSLAQVLARTGRIAEAHETYLTAISVPGMQIKTLAQYRAFQTRVMPPNGPAALAEIDRASEDMRVAGMPEDEGPRLSIVVLPFTNLSGDAGQDYFADGITENLTTDLSRSIHGAFVIARNTAFTYKGKNVDAKEIGKDLGVHYVLEGSVQRDGHQVRVNAQLIDAETGAHLWADRFDDDLADLFKLQDEIVARLARALQIELVNAESQKSLRDRSQNPDAIDLTMQGWSVTNQPPSKEHEIAARNLFRQALQLDPSNVDALAGSAFADMRDNAFGWSDPKIDARARSLELVERALAIDSNHIYANYVKSALLLQSVHSKDSPLVDEAIAIDEAAIRADPSFAPGYYMLSIGESTARRYEQAKLHLEQVMKISPRDPGMGAWQSLLGGELDALGQHDAAVLEELKAIDAGYRTYIPYATLAAAYIEMGKPEEARKAWAEAIRANPNLSVNWYRLHQPFLLEAFPNFIDSLRKVGLPEE
jgi:TolB-like protein/Tfp pilus assembly protein PilF